MESTNQETPVGRTAALGASHLFIGKVLSSLIGLVGSLLVIRLLDPTSYGLISVALVVPGVFGILGDVGVSQAVIKFLAGSNRLDASHKSRIGTVLTYDILLGALLTVACFYSSDWLNMHLFGKPEATELAAVASFTVFASTIYAGVWSALIGLDATRYNAMMLIANYTVQTIVAPALVLLGFGPVGAIYGYVLAPASASLLGGSVLALRGHVARGTFQDLKTMIRYGAPLAGAAALIGVQGQVYNILLATYVATEIIGNYAAATKFSVVMDIAMTPLLTVLFPAFAKLRDDQNGRISEVFRRSIIYSSILIVPLGMGAIVLSRALTEVIIGPSYSIAWIFLALGAVNWLYAGFGVPIVNLLLAGQGETDLVFLLSVVNAIVGVAAGLILVPLFGAVGVPVASLLSAWPQYVMGVRALRRKFGVRLPIAKIGRLFMASFLATAPILGLSQIQIGSVWQVAFGIASAMILYLVIVPKLRVLDETDIRNLTDSFSYVPMAGPIAIRILGILRRLLPRT